MQHLVQTIQERDQVTELGIQGKLTRIETGGKKKQEMGLEKSFFIG